MMTNLKKQHRGSVETLALSAHGDEKIIAEIDELIHVHLPGQPFSRNTLIRIKDIVDNYLGGIDE